MQITVHSFKVWNGRDDTYLYPVRKRTAERIADLPYASIIPGTEQTVDSAELDDEGRYDPCAREKRS